MQYDQPNLPDLARAREFIDSVPWRQVGNRPGGPLNKPAEKHWYHIISTEHAPGAWEFVDLIREHGYRGRYTPPYSGRTMTFRYLEIDEHVFWFVWPRQIAKTRIEFQQHERIDDSIRMESSGSIRIEPEPEPAQMTLDLGGAR